MSLTKEEALKKIDELKQYVDTIDQKETKTLGIAIKNRWTGEIIFQSTKTTMKEAVREALDSSSNLRGSNLRGSDLSGSNLRGSDLRGSNLSSSDLSSSDLSSSDLSSSDLSGSNLRGSDLSSSDLSSSNLSSSDLSSSNLRGSNLQNTELQNVKFYGRGGTKPLLRSQLPDFLAALGFTIEEN
jgi:uncharacterized protein YjbI with pentapeptide repeats